MFHFRKIIMFNKRYFRWVFMWRCIRTFSRWLMDIPYKIDKIYNRKYNFIRVLYLPTQRFGVCSSWSDTFLCNNNYCYPSCSRQISVDFCVDCLRDFLVSITTVQYNIIWYNRDLHSVVAIAIGYLDNHITVDGILWCNFRRDRTKFVLQALLHCSRLMYLLYSTAHYTIYFCSSWKLFRNSGVRTLFSRGVNTL